MTYCLGIHVDAGLVFCSDSRTNAGMDNVSTYSKMHRFAWAGQRHFTVLSAGNLATTQAVMKAVRADITYGRLPNLRSVASVQEAADYIGMTNTAVQRQQGERDTPGNQFEATFILGGQIAGHAPGIFMIYPQGNYIHESQDHPFLQIGEVKYGKPILDRVITPTLDLERAARCGLVSMNSTMRSNATVGPPVELLLYRRNSLNDGVLLSLNEDDPFLRSVSQRWNEGLVQALENLPRFSWEGPADAHHPGGQIYPFPPAT